MQAQKYQATVDSHHRVIFTAPDLPTGTHLEIIALVSQVEEAVRVDWAEKLGAWPRFSSITQVNQYVRDLRGDRDVDSCYFAALPRRH